MTVLFANGDTVTERLAKIDVPAATTTTTDDLRKRLLDA